MKEKSKLRFTRLKEVLVPGPELTPQTTVVEEVLGEGTLVVDRRHQGSATVYVEEAS